MSLLNFSVTSRWITQRNSHNLLEHPYRDDHSCHTIPGKPANVLLFFRHFPTNLVEALPIPEYPQVSPDRGNSKFWLMLCCARDNSVQYWYNIDSIVFMTLCLMKSSLMGVGFSILFWCFFFFFFIFKKIASLFTTQLWKVLEVSSENTKKDFSTVKCSQHLL